MSYCRWSSDNFKCDLYCYKDVNGGYTIHVASYRWRMWYRLLHWLTDKRYKNLDGFRQSRRGFDLFSWPHWITHKKINLPYDDDTFRDKSIKDFYRHVRGLKKLGYKVPNKVIDIIKKEAESD